MIVKQHTRNETQEIDSDLNTLIHNEGRVKGVEGGRGT